MCSLRWGNGLSARSIFGNSSKKMIGRRCFPWDTGVDQALEVGYACSPRAQERDLGLKIVVKGCVDV